MTTSFDVAKKLVVSLTTSNDSMLVYGSSSVPYTIKAASTDTAAATAYEFTASEVNASGGTSKTIGVDVTNWTSQSLPAGDYTD
ncbi:MAG: hypothetical protein IJP86_09510 [Synergistaceae bacterium]|nr:hypothetical protein [Synergistaceae bacterium]